LTLSSKKNTHTPVREGTEIYLATHGLLRISPSIRVSDDEQYEERHRSTIS